LSPLPGPLVSLGGVETIPEHRLSFHAQPEEAVA
jgi:hypothetical protein